MISKKERRAMMKSQTYSRPFSERGEINDGNSREIANKAYQRQRAQATRRTNG